MSAVEQARRFPSPHSITAPEGAEGWEELYPYYSLLSEERREYEDGKFWFFDAMHNPEPMYPFDTIMTQNWPPAEPSSVVSGSVQIEIE